jgi:hypothetical protein
MRDEIAARRSIRRRQAVTNSTSSDSGSTNPTTSHKAGLAWANGNTVDIQPFLATGKVSWCVFSRFSSRSGLTERSKLKVLHLVSMACHLKRELGIKREGRRAGMGSIVLGS